jgi:elongator complex protein 4
VTPAADAQVSVPFCHSFDLSKRITLPVDAKINHIPIDPRSPFETIISSLARDLQRSPPSIAHRLVVPSMLSPALYPPTASHPSLVLKFLHSLRALLRSNSDRLSIVLTLPLELFPRASGLVRWAEILSDGIIELTPFPHLMDAYEEHARSDTAKEGEEQPQGLARIHKLPLIAERGEGGAGAGNSMGEDLAFVVSRRKFVLKPFSLPPIEGDQDAQKEGGKLTGKDIEF